MKNRIGWRVPPILMYHSVSDHAISEAGAELYSVREALFREHLEYLVSNDPHTLVTFDDGYEDNYTVAYPALKDAGLKGYFFVMPSKIGEPGYLDWRQVRELRKEGMTIGSHGMTHRILTTLDNDDLYHELYRSKELIEDNLGYYVNFLSIPRGFCNRRVENMAIKAGYRAIFTSDSIDRSNFKYGRIPVKAHWDVGRLDMALNSRIPLRDLGRRIAIGASKRLFGPTGYDRLRTLVLSRR